MNNIMSIVVICSIIFILSGCSYKVGSANINKVFFKSSKEVKSKRYKELGMVSYVETGWLWSSCDSMIDKSTKKLELIAKSRGADAILNVNWQGKNGIQSNYPQCRTVWGWMFFLPGVFIPGTSETTIYGTMIEYSN